MKNETKPAIFCPQCDHEVWDTAKGSKLNKCWDCNLAFDNESTGCTSGCETEAEHYAHMQYLNK